MPLNSSFTSGNPDREVCGKQAIVETVFVENRIHSHTHTSHIQIIPVSHKIYSKGYILHFLQKKLNKQLTYYYG